jgi:hypothetical protein
MLEVKWEKSIEGNKNKELNIKYLDRIISNKINKNFFNSYKEYNINKNEFVLFFDKHINKINEYYDNNKSNKIKKYIFTKIFQEQYIMYLNHNAKLERKLINFYEICS